MSAAPSANDRNLLFGIVALQFEFVTRDQLVAAMNAWVLAKQKPLADILVEQHALSASRRAMLEPLIAEHLRQHGDDPQRSLAALSSVDDARQALEGLKDPDVNASLGHLKPQLSPQLRQPRDKSFSGETVAPGSGHGGAEAGPFSGATCAPFSTTPHESGSRFRILRHHAMGGLGVVFVAHDQEVNRQVAVKEIKHTHADEPECRARFLLEAEITGGLEHPGIVPVYSLGHYPDGRPFYAMRFIKGDSLEEAIDAFHAADAPGAPRRDPTERAIALRQLLRRFIDVCNAIDYAHSKGILHRDLKPGNIMLGKYGETLVVDWGLAKPMGETEQSAVRQLDELPLTPSSGSQSAPTLMGSAIGTPSYMPPEQAAGRHDMLGPASDVYSLGATLYSLLTGQSPFATGNIADILARVQRADFPAPRAIRPAVDRRLEAICLKAMAKDSQSRYASAAALRQDVENWIADAPIAACPDPFSVKLRRFLMRHRVAAATTAASLLVAALFLAVLALVLGKKNEQLAELAANESKAKLQAEEKEEVALSRLKQIEKQNQVLESIFTDIDPRRAEKGGPLLIEQLTKRLMGTADSLNADTLGDPLAVARLQSFLGATLVNLGEPASAIELQKKARKTRETLLGPDHPDTLASMNHLAEGYQAAGKLDLAVPLLEETFRLRKAKLGPDHLDTLMSMNNLALGYQAAGKLESSLPLLEETLKRRNATLGIDHSDTLTSMNNLAIGYHAAGKFDSALPLLEEVRDLFKAKLGPDHADTLMSMNNLASSYHSAGKLDLALPLYEETWKIRKATLGHDHPDALMSMSNLAYGYYSAGKVDLALPLFQEAYKLLKAKRGPDHPFTLTCLNNLASACEAAGKYDLALALYEENFNLLKTKLGPDHPTTLTSMGNLAKGYHYAGKLDLALQFHEETLKLRKAKLGPDHPDTIMSMNNLAAGYEAVSKIDLALPLYEESFKLSTDKLGPDHPTTLSCRNNLANGYQAAGKFDLALQHYEETLKIRKAKLGPDHPDTLISMNNVAFGYFSAGKVELAVTLFEEAYELLKTKLGPDHPTTLVGMNNLAVGYQSTGKLDLALPIIEEAVKLRKAKLGPEHPDTLQTMNNLASAYQSSGKNDLAVPLYDEVLKVRKAKLGFDHADTLDSIDNLARAYLKSPDPEKGTALFDEFLATRAKQWGREDSRLAGRMALIAMELLKHDQFPAAERISRECLAIRTKNMPEDWTTFNTQAVVGAALLGQKKIAEAEPLLLDGYRGMKARETKIPSQGKNRLTEAEGRIAHLFDVTRDFTDENIKGELTAGQTQAKHEIKLEAGKPVVFFLRSKDFDPVLKITDEAGKRLAENDDIDYAAKNLDSRILIFPTAAGVYRLTATSYQRKGRGAYEIVIRRYARAKT